MKRGFTMIELLVTITIIGILVTLGLVSYTSATRAARNGKRAADMEGLRSALVLYRSDRGTYPAGDFTSIVSQLNTNGYYSSPALLDPKNGTSPYAYEYSRPTTTTFSLCYYKEPTGTRTCLANP